MKSASLRRIKADIRELSSDPSDQYYASPLESDMFEWHFTIRGPPDSEFAGGIYHGKILLPPEYPMKPPNIIFMTPSGRFETNVKVCLSFSAHHPELWQPAWGVRLILEAIISFLPTPADGAIGALDWSKEERAKLAKESTKFHCPMCCAAGQSCADLLPELKPVGDTSDNGGMKRKFQEEIEKLKMLQGMHHAKEEEAEAEETTEDKDEEETEQCDDTDESTKLLPKVSEGSAEVISSTPVPGSQETNPLPQETDEDVNPAPLPDDNTTKQNCCESGDEISTLEQSTSTDAVTSPPVTNHADETGETTASNQPNVIPVSPTPEITNQVINPAAAPESSILVTEPFLNGMIFAFAVTVTYLLMEAHSLLDEFHELRSQG